MVSLVRLQSQLLQRLNSFFSQFSHFSGENSLGVDSRVDTVGLDGDNHGTLVLQEQVRVQSDNTGLIRSSHIGENSVDHTHQHSVFLRVTGVIDDWDHIWSLLGHSNQFSTGSVGEFHGVHNTFWSDNIGDVRHRGTGSGTQVQHFFARSDTELIDTTHNTGSQFGSERIPHTVFDLGWNSTFLGAWLFNRDSLFTVDGLTWGDVLGDQQIFFASGDENTGVSVWFDDNLGSASGTTSGTTTATTATGTASWTTSSSTSTAKSTSSTTSGTATAAAKATSGTTATTETTSGATTATEAASGAASTS